MKNNRFWSIQLPAITMTMCLLFAVFDIYAYQLSHRTVFIWFVIYQVSCFALMSFLAKKTDKWRWETEINKKLLDKHS